MKKIVFIGLLVCSLLLSACHGTKGTVLPSTEVKIPDSFDTNKKYTISFWAKNDTNYRQLEVYEEAIRDFEALYPNIHVEMKSYTDYNTIYQDVITNIPTETTPNVCISYPDHIATYLTGTDVVLPISSWISDEKYGLGGSELRFDSPKKEDIVPEFLNECIVNGDYYLLPFMRSTEACYINEDMVKALGYEVPDILTWDFIFEVSEKAVEKDADGNYKINGQKTMIPFIYKSTDNMMIQMLRQKDAPYSDNNGNIQIFGEETKDVLRSVIEPTKCGAFSTFKISSYPANFLNKGQCIFAIDSTAGATWMGTNAPLSDIHGAETVSFNTLVRPVPQYDTENVKMISQGPSVCLFQKKDEGEMLASWLFAQFLLTDKVQVNYSETEGYLPVTLKAGETEEYKEYLSLSGTDNDLHYSVKIDAAKLLMEHTNDTFVTPVFNGSASLRQAAGDLIENVVKSVRRNQTVDEAYFDSLFTNMVSLHKLDQVGTSGSAGPKDLGPLPPMAIGLLISVGVVWVGLLLVVILRKRHKKG